MHYWFDTILKSKTKQLCIVTDLGTNVSSFSFTQISENVWLMLVSVNSNDNNTSQSFGRYNFKKYYYGHIILA